MSLIFNLIRYVISTIYRRTNKYLIYYYLRSSLSIAGQYSSIHTLTNYLPSLTSGPKVGGLLSVISTRTNIRNHFPRAKESKRIRVHGWNKRMSTSEGRRVLMRRILKGRHVLSH